MSSIRLFILATLAEHGPSHGYQVLRQAQEDRTDLWTDFRTSGVYSALKRMKVDGFVEEVRSEQAGNYPERTVYRLTESGLAELASMHEQALGVVEVYADPFDLALSHERHVSPARLQDLVGQRIEVLEGRLDKLQAQQEEADPWLSATERLALDHVAARCRAELEWHRTLPTRLRKIAADRERDE